MLRTVRILPRAFTSVKYLRHENGNVCQRELTLDNVSVTTSSQGANGVFAYGDAAIHISDSTVTTNGAGGIMVAGGSLYAEKCTVTTAGGSSAAIRSDRGSSPFSDVKESDYFYKAVLWAVANGITAGTSETTFSPNTECTRGQAVTFLYRASGKPSVSGISNPFTDVQSGSYFCDAVLWAVDNGITKGTSTTTFSPDDTCTRAQVVTFLYRDLAE